MTINQNRNPSPKAIAVSRICAMYLENPVGETSYRNEINANATNTEIQIPFNNQN